MPAGTIALRNNTATVTGTGTSFTTEIKANDFIVVIIGQVTYTLGVKSVNSNTSVTLIRNFDGPTSSGLAWTAIPNATLVGITAQVAADTAKAIRGLNLDKVNWQQILTGTGNVTVNLPDGSVFSGPAWGGINEELKGKAPLTDGVVAVRDGGTGGKNASEALTALGGVSRTGDQIIEGLKTFASRLTAPFYHSSAGYPGLTLICTDMPEAMIGRTVVIEHHGNGLYVTRRKGNGSDNTNQILNSFPAGGGVLALASSSDERIKTKDGLTPAGALSRLAQLEVHDFHYKHVEPYVQEYQSERPRRGFMAQQVYSVDETYANKPTSNLDNLNPAGGEVWEINEHALIADLVLAVRELRAELEELKTIKVKT